LHFHWQGRKDFNLWRRGGKRRRSTKSGAVSLRKRVGGFSLTLWGNWMEGNLSFYLRASGFLFSGEKKEKARSKSGGKETFFFQRGGRRRRILPHLVEGSGFTAKGRGKKKEKENPSFLHERKVGGKNARKPPTRRGKDN